MTFALKGASGAITGRRFELDEDTLIGSGGESGIRLDGLMERHARIVYDGERLTIESAQSVVVNGEPGKRHILGSGDEIRIGEHRFVLQAPGLRPASVLGQSRPRRWIWMWAAGAGVLAAVAAIAWYVMQSAPAG